MPSRRRHQQEDEEDESEEERTKSTQRGRRHASPSEGDEEEDAEEDEDGMEVDGGHGIDQLVKKLVRYALTCEYQRTTIKRQDINMKVIGGQRGAFKHVFEGAQKQLRMKFGMEMAELPVKEKVTVKEKRAAQKTKGTSKPPPQYILTTILPPEYRTPEIMPPSIVGSQEDEATYIGLVSMIVSIVALSPDGAVPDHKLMSYLRRLNIDENNPLDKTSNTLRKMQAQGYLVKTVDKTPDDETTDWRVGPRGKVEIVSRGTQGLIREVYGDDAPEDLVKRIHRSLGIEPASANHDPSTGEEQDVDDSMVNGHNDENGDPGSSRRRRRDADE